MSASEVSVLFRDHVHNHMIDDANHVTSLCGLASSGGNNSSPRNIVTHDEVSLETQM